MFDDIKWTFSYPDISNYIFSNPFLFTFLFTMENIKNRFQRNLCVLKFFISLSLLYVTLKVKLWTDKLKRFNQK